MCVRVRRHTCTRCAWPTAGPLRTAATCVACTVVHVAHGLSPPAGLPSLPEGGRLRGYLRLSNAFSSSKRSYPRLSTHFSSSKRSYLRLSTTRCPRGHAVASHITHRLVRLYGVTKAPSYRMPHHYPCIWHQHAVVLRAYTRYFQQILVTGGTATRHRKRCAAKML